MSDATELIDYYIKLCAKYGEQVQFVDKPHWSPVDYKGDHAKKLMQRHKDEIAAIKAGFTIGRKK